MRSNCLSNQARLVRQKTQQENQDHLRYAWNRLPLIRIEPELLWGIIHKDIPVLALKINRIRS